MASKKQKKQQDPNSATVALNRRARFDYDIVERFDAGISLTGSEIKSLRAGKVDLAGSYARLRRREVWLEGVNIAPYANAGYAQHDSRRDRKLLLHRREINKIGELLNEKGLTLVPLRIYLKDGVAKVELGVARGMRKYDKRQRIREREEGRQVARAIRRGV